MLSSNHHRVLGVLLAGRMNFRQLEEASDVSGSILGQTLRDLRELKYVRGGGVTKYSITGKGVQAYEATR